MTKSLCGIVEVFYSLSESFKGRSGRPTVLVPVVSPPNNCFGIRSSDMRATYTLGTTVYSLKLKSIRPWVNNVTCHGLV